MEKIKLTRNSFKSSLSFCHRILIKTKINERKISWYIHTGVMISGRLKLSLSLCVIVFECEYVHVCPFSLVISMTPSHSPVLSITYKIISLCSGTCKISDGQINICTWNYILRARVLLLTVERISRVGNKDRYRRLLLLPRSRGWNNTPFL